MGVALAIYRHAGGGWHAWGCYRHNAWVRAGSGTVVTEGERQALRLERRRRAADRATAAVRARGTAIWVWRGQAPPSPSVVFVLQQPGSWFLRPPTFAEAIGRFTGHPARTPWHPAVAAGA